MKHIRLAIATFLALFSVGIALPSVALAATAKETVCETLGSDAACATNPTGGTSVDSVVALVVNVLSAIVAIAAVIMIIVAGFRLVLSNGDSNTVSSARNAILYAIIGLVVVAISQAIVFFVLGKL